MSAPKTAAKAKQAKKKVKKNIGTGIAHIQSTFNNTVVTITAAPDVTGLPNTPAMLDQGQKLEFFAGGSMAHPGDLGISASKPIAVANYMTGFGNLPATNDGDPAMVPGSCPAEHPLSAVTGHQGLIADPATRALEGARVPVHIFQAQREVQHGPLEAEQTATA